MLKNLLQRYTNPRPDPMTIGVEYVPLIYTYI
jgi:hypothetical protein